jgi:HEAT repeat protein
MRRDVDDAAGMAISTLGDMGTPRAHESIALALDDPHPHHRMAAIMALWARGAPATRYFPMVFRHLLDPDPSVRREAAKVFGLSEPPEPVEPLAYPPVSGE